MDVPPLASEREPTHFPKLAMLQREHQRREAYPPPEDPLSQGGRYGDLPHQTGKAYDWHTKSLAEVRRVQREVQQWKHVKDNAHHHGDAKRKHQKTVRHAAAPVVHQAAAVPAEEDVTQPKE